MAGCATCFSFNKLFSRSYKSRQIMLMSHFGGFRKHMKEAVSDKLISDEAPSKPYSQKSTERNRRKFEGDFTRQSYNNRDRNFKGSFQDKYPREKNRGYEEEAKEPVYGYYDGDHIYGINPVKIALKARRRDISELLVQEGMKISQKNDSQGAQEILNLCKELNVTVREFSKHDLNMLTDNKLHQGFVLRARPLTFESIKELPPSDEYKCILALDEVWDPQNFGALLRSSFFLKCDGVVTCAKNSAPLSPAVSKASAGAMELMTIYSVDNMMKFLDNSRENGWQVIGTSLAPESVAIDEIDLTKPTILILGNEGHGIRTNILKRCTQLVKIGSNAVDNDMVDSLNVSVTGGIILHHLLASSKAPKKK